MVLPSSEVGQAISRKSWLQAQCSATFPCFNGLMVGEKWQLRERTWKSRLRRKLISYPENTRTAVERFCSVTRNSSIPRVNAVRSAKVRAPPRLYVGTVSELDVFGVMP